jgi:protein involved in polysaccharide export with SLBB domain
MKSLKAAIYAIIGLGLVAIAACSTGPASADPQAQPTKQPATAVSLEGYRLGPGDEIKVTVFGEPDLSGPFVVDGLGTIPLNLVGQIEVKNLTLVEVQQKIETTLKNGWLNEPRVAAELTKGRPYYILGEVNRAGEYPFTSGLTVMNAIAAAGDFTYRADRKRIVVTSGDGAEREIVLTPTTPVKPGDRIRIRERFF